MQIKLDDFLKVIFWLAPLLEPIILAIIFKISPKWCAKAVEKLIKWFLSEKEKKTIAPLFSFYYNRKETKKDIIPKMTSENNRGKQSFKQINYIFPSTQVDKENVNNSDLENLKKDMSSIAKEEAQKQISELETELLDKLTKKIEEEVKKDKKFKK